MIWSTPISNKEFFNFSKTKPYPEISWTIHMTQTRCNIPPQLTQIIKIEHLIKIKLDLVHQAILIPRTFSPIYKISCKIIGTISY